MGAHRQMSEKCPQSGDVVRIQSASSANRWVLLLLFGTASTQALFHFAGLPRTVPVLITEFCVLVYCTRSLFFQMRKHKRFPRVPGTSIVLAFFAVAIISFATNRPDPLAALLSFRQDFIFLFFFLALQIAPIRSREVESINALIVLIVLLQLPAGMVKYMVHGQDEFWIGTISASAGSLSTLYPLVAISFLASFFCFTGKIRYVLIAFAFFLFGLAGEKRAIAFYLPVVLVSVVTITLLLRRKQAAFRKSQLLKMYSGILIICVICLFIATQTIRTLNPQLKMFGAFDLGYLIKDRIVGYNFRTMEEKTDPTDPYRLELKDPNGKIRIFKHNSAMGRGTLTIESVRRAWDGGWWRTAIGFGPGTMIRSPHIGRSGHTPFEKFGILGSYTGFVVAVLQYGFAGVACILAFWLTLFVRIWRTAQNASCLRLKMTAVGCLGALLIVILDFLTYSQTTLTQHALAPAILYVTAMVLNGFSGPTSPYGLYAGNRISKQ